jgi:hypothetical protein
LLLFFKKEVLPSFPVPGIHSEMTHKLRAAHIKETPQTHVIVEDDAARAALAALFGLPGIGRLRGEFVLVHEQAGIIAATLKLSAEITQTCVLTLEPFDSRIDEQATIRFIPAAKIAEAEEVELDPESLDGPDEIPFTGEFLDLSAALAEQLALSLDPYPKKPGAVLPAEFTDEPENPFSILKFRK